MSGSARHYSGRPLTQVRGMFAPKVIVMLADVLALLEGRTDDPLAKAEIAAWPAEGAA
jgi:hypothetical protein